jgi:serine phosphatase RsbU (regulator of sigma subunit)
MGRQSGRWFRVAVAAGFALGVLLLITTIYTFRYVVRHLIFDHLSSDAGQIVSQLENAARTETPADGAALVRMLDAVARQRTDEVAWIRIADQGGRILGAVAGISGETLPPAVVESLLVRRAPSVVEARTSPRGEVLVVTLPFRYQFPDERVARALPRETAGQPRFKIAELALYVESSAGVFWPLRRALVISLAAAIALLVAMTVFALQFRQYVRAKQAEQQLAIARRVQHDLLPPSSAGGSGIDFAVEFLPYSEVGGDYYDVFPVSSSEVAVVLGDVAGKGLPAALLMGVVHGAVRGAAARWTSADLAERAQHLNELLCSRTAGNRYVTLFWGSVDTAAHKLRYVNAGHVPPLLARRSADGTAEVERLEAGGPVLGLLPDAPLLAGETHFGDGDVLIAFSDGLSEAANASDEEYGSTRVAEVISTHLGRPPADILARILESVSAFRGSEPLHDDLSLLVVRAGPAAASS